LALRDVLNVGPEVEAYRNGRPVVDKHNAIVRPGDRLEFMKPYGEKGGTEPFLRSPGGKSKPAAQRAVFGKIPPLVGEYREPFVGGGSLALRIDEYCKPSRVQINDIDANLIAVWMAAQQRPREFVEMCLEHHPYKDNERETEAKNRKIRELYRRALYDETMDPALRYFICNRVGWNGRVNFAMPSRIGCLNPRGWNVRAIRRIEKAAPYVREWEITCGDYNDVLLVPGENVWCVNDAPYFKDTLASPSSKLYAHSFTVKQHCELAEAVAASAHNILLTYDNCEEIRQLYLANGGFHLFDESWTYCGSSMKKKKKGRELIVTNYAVNQNIPREME
jgi:DNA adenine methylase